MTRMRWNNIQGKSLTDVLDCWFANTTFFRHLASAKTLLKKCNNVWMNLSRNRMHCCKKIKILVLRVLCRVGECLYRHLVQLETNGRDFWKIPENPRISDKIVQIWGSTLDGYFLMKIWSTTVKLCVYIESNKGYKMSI